MTHPTDASSADGPASLEDLLRREIVRTGASAAEVDCAIRFIASARGRSPSAYQALPRRMRRLVDLLAAA